MPGISLIAEYKRRSPAAGDLPRGGEPVGDLVRAYERGGAAALSILTDGPHFGGSLGRPPASPRDTDLPILRKDFTIDPYQLYEAAAGGRRCAADRCGARAGGARTPPHRGQELDLDCLVEVHDAKSSRRPWRSTLT